MSRVPRLPQFIWPVLASLLLVVAADRALAQQTSATGGAGNSDSGSDAAQPAPPDLNGHPLQPAMDMAWRSRQSFTWADDYTCTLLKNEHVDGELTGHDNLYMKIRREPFSLYIYTLGPVKPRGQEAIYVEGKNDNLVIAHAVGLKSIAGTMRLEPTDSRLMEGNRRPLTAAGIDNLLERIIDGYTADSQYGECEVRIIPDATIDGRVCDVVQVIHPVRRTNFRYYMSRAYFDREWNIPIRWEAYDWPSEAGGKPPLLEEYTYRNLKFDVGLTAADFDSANPKYDF